MTRPDIEGSLSVLSIASDEALSTRLQAQADDATTGIDLHRAKAFDAALDAVTSEQVDCVTTAYRLDDETGIDLVRAIREEASDLPIILYTDEGSETIAAEATRAGATEYHPVASDSADLADLLDRVVTLGRRYREERTSATDTNRYERTLERATDGIYSLDVSWRIEYVNETMATRIGRDRDSLLGAVLWEEFPSLVGTDHEEQFRTAIETGEPTAFQEYVEDPFGYWVEVRAFPDEDGLTVFSRDISAQKTLERRLRALQEVTQRLNTTTSMAEVGTVAVEAAADILDLELTAMWEYDEVEQELVPVAATDDVRATLGELPHFTPGESLAWDTFVDGDLDVYEDIPNTDGIHNPETVIQCEIIAPLGRHGLLMTGSTTAQSFSNRDIDLFSILAASVEAALGRAEREEELRRQNQRLGEFADVVAHDLRNPLTVAQGFLDVARETGDDAHFAEVEWAHRRMETLIDDLLTLAHSGRTIDSPEQIALETVAREAWVHLDTADASCTISPELPVIEGDESRLLQLFENLFRNAIQHGGDRVNISVEPLASGDGFFVADDGPGIDPENRLAVLEHGVTFSDDGTGLGLAIASEIVHAHGWSIRVTDSASGGARFEFSFEESSTRD